MGGSGGEEGKGEVGEARVKGAERRGATLENLRAIGARACSVEFPRASR